MTVSNSHLPTQSEPRPAKGGWRIWHWLVEPAASIQEVGARRRARLFSSILVVLIPLVLNGVIQTARFDQPIFGALLGLLPVLVLAYGLSRTKHYQLGIALTLTALSAVVFASFLLGDDYSSPVFLLESLIWMAQAIVLGSILLSLQGTVVLIVANLLGLALLPVFIPEIPISSLAVLLGFMANISVLIMVGYRHRNLLEKDRQAELTERNQELRAARALLEQRLADLTRATRVLETSEALGRRLATILNQRELISAVVEQVGEALNHAQANIYLFDEAGEYLVEGSGEAGQGLPAREYKIPRGQGLVGRAAETKQVVLVSDVTQEAAWLPHPFLPETKAEAAAPIIFGGQVLGVLDVQSDKVDGLDEGDATMLQALANQVVVSLRNAHQFEQVQQALARAQTVQEQYVEQSWDRNKVARQNKGQVRFSVGESTTLTEEAVAQARKIAMTSPKATTAAFDKGNDNAYVAPITLRNVPIGNLQLHGFESDADLSDGDRALVEAIVDQVAQAAENLRLINETQERASRERLIGQVSDRLRRAPDFETLMKVGVEELSKVLGPARTFVHFGTRAELGGETLESSELVEASELTVDDVAQDDVIQDNPAQDMRVQPTLPANGHHGNIPDPTEGAGNGQGDTYDE